MKSSERNDLLRPQDPLYREVNADTRLVMLEGVHSFHHFCKGDAFRINKDLTVLVRTYPTGSACAFCRKCNTLFASVEKGDPVEEFRRNK